MKNHTVVRAVIMLLSFVLFASACGASTESSADNAAATETDSQVEDAAVSDDPATQDGASDDAATDGAAAADADTDESTVENTGANTAGANIDLFFDGALAEEVTTEDCTLSDGTASTCYRITVAGYPADHEVGPFCPATTETSADDAGIWFDGNGLYDLDGDFILGLAELYDDSNWMLYDEDGNVNITETQEAFEGAARPDVAEEYQNHCVEGQIEWLDNGEPVTTTVLIPTEPVLTNNAGRAGRGGLGVTLNGVTIAAAAPVDAILGAYTIAAFDDCGGHINPVDGYHLHGALGCGEVEVDGHASIFGYAVDGFGIYSPYDEAGEEYGDLDSCGGHTTDELGYHYHASPAADNAVISCLNGATVTG